MYKGRRSGVEREGFEDGIERDDEGRRPRVGRDGFVWGAVARTDDRVPRVQWQTTIPGLVEPSVDEDGTVYCSTDEGIVALNGTDGGVEWEVSTGEALLPAAVAGRVYAAGRDGGVYAVEGGKPVWATTLPESVAAPVAVAGGAVHALTERGTVAVLATATGREAATLRVDRAACTGVTVARERTYVTSMEGGLYGIAGGDRWRYAPDRAIGAAPVVGDGTVFVGTVDGGLVAAVDPGTGAERWRRSLDGRVWTGVTVEDDVVYAATDAGSVVALGAEDGYRRWGVSVGAPTWTSPVVAGGLVHVGTVDGRVVAIDDAGTVVGSISTDAPVTGLAANGRTVYAVDGTETVYAIGPDESVTGP